jgi:predicted SnoaL-like aldol condensation-catalyzing enzyme
MSAENKEMVVHFYDELFGPGNLAVIDKYVGPEYIQHNPHAANGAEALRGFIKYFRGTYPNMQYRTARVIAEDDLVLLHSHAVTEPGTPGQAVVDMFRVKDGKVDEHWDVIQDVPDTTVSGNDMFSTLSDPAGSEPDLSVSAAESKQVVLDLFKELIHGRDVTAVDRYLGDPYYQHNPQQPNGKAGAKEQFVSTFAAVPDFSVSVKRVIAEGDLVAVHHHLKFNADHLGIAVIDIFRVRGGKIVEHWDIAQPVPEKSANDNTMF